VHITVHNTCTNCYSAEWFYRMKVPIQSFLAHVRFRQLYAEFNREPALVDSTKSTYVHFIAMLQR
jgi:hypothetical protein